MEICRSTIYNACHGIMGPPCTIYHRLDAQLPHQGPYSAIIGVSWKDSLLNGKLQNSKLVTDAHFTVP